MIIALLLTATTVSYGDHTHKDNTLRISHFADKESAQKFYQSIPQTVTKQIKHENLLLSVSQNVEDFGSYHIDIDKIPDDIAKKICDHTVENQFKCQHFKQQKFDLDVAETKTPVLVVSSRENIASSTDLKHPKNKDLNTLTNYKKFKPVENNLFDFRHDEENFSLNPTLTDDIEESASKKDYIDARNAFLNTVRRIGEGINADQGEKVAEDELLRISQKALEHAGSAYFHDLMNKHYKTNKQTENQDQLIHNKLLEKIRENFALTAKETARDLINTTLSESDQSPLRNKVDTFVLNNVRSLVDMSIEQVRRSDLYLLRHLEFEYNLNNFEDAYFSALGVQPLYQSKDLQHNIFFQGSAIINEQSVDINDDESRHTVNLGLAYRYLTDDEKTLLGFNTFFDHQWPYHHSRISIGIDAQSEDLSVAANYYIPVSGFKNSRNDAVTNTNYEETALEGYDVEVGYTPKKLKDLTLFAKGYHYFRDDISQDDLFGFEISAEYQITDQFKLRGALIEENGGRDGGEISLQYSIPLYDTNDVNLAYAEIKKSSMRSKIFNKVRRENRIRVGERNSNNVVVSAQFSGSSIGLPFDVGGTATGAGVTLPFDTAITVPNGDFGIIQFNNGAIANVSASGSGDVVLEFNATTLTVTNTNGGFVQFISGSSGGIQTINVPGGTVNLLGTDVDISNDATTTTVQVRAGMIEIVPDIGSSTINGNQGDIVSLGIATGTTSLLTNPDYETRQEAAFTNLDLLNPAPANNPNEAPFINRLPELITGPQFVGNNADLRLTFTQSVTVSGMPQVNGLVDANSRIFTYNAAASTPTQLVFRHVYVAGDVGASNITVQSLDLNGGTITGSSNGLNALTAFTEATLTINDTTSPSFSSSTPTDNEPSFAIGDDIVLNFNENIQANTGTITLTDISDGTDNRNIPVTDPQVAISGSTLTLNPSTNLELGTDYDLTIANNVIQDTAGNPFAGITSGTFNFTTSNDIAPPVVISTSPIDNSTNVSVNSDLVINFDENIQAGTGNIVLTDQTNATDNRTISITDPQVTISGSTLTINPSSDLEISTVYDVTMGSGVIQDSLGNNFSGLSSGEFNFSTTAITSLSQIIGLPQGNYIISANSETFNGYVETSLGSSWLLVGRGREGWEFDADGQATNADVISNLGTTAAFPPAAYSNAIINDLITNAGINLTNVEIRIKRAANISGTSYQEILWRPITQASWVWSFDTPSPGYAVEHEVLPSILGAGGSTTGNTRDIDAGGNGGRRIFTWSWVNHGSQKGFSYGNLVGGVDNNDPNTFLWESTNESHALGYTEVYIRVE